jgi:predicted metal-binding protein
MRQKILERVPQEQLEQDLERYRQRALELGATDAKVITTDKVIIDERVLAKCTYPKCPSYGTNANCPPHAMSLELVRKVVGNFSYGIFLKLEVPPEHTAGQEAIDKGLFNPYRRKLSEIAAKIEAEAFYDGYHLALAFASGSCKGTFCPDMECQALLPGQPCRYPLKSRASMEGAGMDVYTMATKVGWDIYPIGAATSPRDVPCGMRLALVLIY